MATGSCAPVNVPAVFIGPLDGVVGADTPSSFDVDLDLPHYRMILYQRQACPDAKPAWTKPYEDHSWPIKAGPPVLPGAARRPHD
jgi:hypothetical protein